MASSGDPSSSPRGRGVFPSRQYIQQFRSIVAYRPYKNRGSGFLQEPPKGKADQNHRKWYNKLGLVPMRPTIIQRSPSPEVKWNSLDAGDNYPQNRGFLEVGGDNHRWSTVSEQNSRPLNMPVDSHNRRWSATPMGYALEDYPSAKWDLDCLPDQGPPAYEASMDERQEIAKDVSNFKDFKDKKEPIEIELAPSISKNPEPDSGSSRKRKSDNRDFVNTASNAASPNSLSGSPPFGGMRRAATFSTFCSTATASSSVFSKDIGRRDSQASTASSISLLSPHNADEVAEGQPVKRRRPTEDPSAVQNDNLEVPPINNVGTQQPTLEPRRPCPKKPGSPPPISALLRKTATFNRAIKRLGTTIQEADCLDQGVDEHTESGCPDQVVEITGGIQQLKLVGFKTDQADFAKGLTIANTIPIITEPGQEVSSEPSPAGMTDINDQEFETSSDPGIDQNFNALSDTPHFDNVLKGTELYQCTNRNYLEPPREPWIIPDGYASSPGSEGWSIRSGESGCSSCDESETSSDYPEDEDGWRIYLKVQETSVNTRVADEFKLRFNEACNRGQTSPSDAGDAQNQSSGSFQTVIPGRSRASSRASQTSSKKHQRDGQDEEEEEEEDVPSRQRKKAKADDPHHHLACPYQKTHPEKYHDPSCLRSFRTVHRVKEHLYEKHRLYTCARCKVEFKEGDFGNHQLMTPACPVISTAPDPKSHDWSEGFNDAQQKQLKSRKGLKRLNEKERWIHVWFILFPLPRAVPPSPYTAPQIPLSAAVFEQNFNRSISERLMQVINTRFEEFAQGLVQQIPDLIANLDDETRQFGQDLLDRHLRGFRERTAEFTEGLSIQIPQLVREATDEVMRPSTRSARRPSITVSEHVDDQPSLTPVHSPRDPMTEPAAQEPESSMSGAIPNVPLSQSRSSMESTAFDAGAAPLSSPNDESTGDEHIAFKIGGKGKSPSIGSGSVDIGNLSGVTESSSAALDFNFEDVMSHQVDEELPSNCIDPQLLR